MKTNLFLKKLLIAWKVIYLKLWLPFLCGTQLELFVAVQAALLNAMKVNGENDCQARFTVINYISGCSSNKSIIWHYKTWNIKKNHMDYFYDFFPPHRGSFSVYWKELPELQNILFCVPEIKDSHTCLERREGE